MLAVLPLAKLCIQVSSFLLCYTTFFYRYPHLELGDCCNLVIRNHITQSWTYAFPEDIIKYDTSGEVLHRNYVRLRNCPF